MINSKNKGTQYELRIINELKDLGFEAESTRNTSRKLDAQAVDIISDIPFHIQCKRVEKLHDPEGILKRMPTDKTPVIFTKKSHKQDIVFMDKQTFYRILLLLDFDLWTRIS
jgi:hypothetical protein